MPWLADDIVWFIVSEGFFLHKRGKPKFPQPCLYTQGSYVCIEMKSTEKAKL